MIIEVVMNKKGYTLVEIIVVIALIASIGVVGAIGLTKIISNSKQTRYDEMIKDMKAASNTYFTIYSEYDEYSYLKTDLYGSGSVTIPIQTLKEALLVDQKLKNPKDNTLVDGCVKITLNSGSLNYKVCPYENCGCDFMIRSGTDSATGLPIVKIGNEVFLDITNAIDYSSLINTNGNLYNYASGKSILLAKYNLYVGRNCNSSGSCTLINTSDSKYGLQSVDAKGYVNVESDVIGVAPFAGSNLPHNYYLDNVGMLKSQYGSNYVANNIYDTDYASAPNYDEDFYDGNSNYSVAYYVEEYVNRLGVGGVGRLLTYTEAMELTTNQRTNGARYWLGTAYDLFDIRCVINNGMTEDFGSIAQTDNSNGIRPVLVVNTSNIKE